MERESLATVLERRTPELLEIPGVLGTGESAEDGESVFVIFVERRTRELEARLPRVIDGYRVVVRETGAVTAPPR